MENQDSLLTSLLFGRHSSESSPDPVNPYLSSIIGSATAPVVHTGQTTNNPATNNGANQIDNQFTFPANSLREPSQQPVQVTASLGESKELQNLSFECNNSLSRASFQSRSFRKNRSVSRKASIFESLTTGQSEAELREAIHQAERIQRQEEEEEEALLQRQEQQQIEEEERNGDNIRARSQSSQRESFQEVLVDAINSSGEPHNDFQNIRSVVSENLTPELEFQEQVTAVSPVAPSHIAPPIINTGVHPVEVKKQLLPLNSSYPFPEHRSENVNSGSSSSQTPLLHENTGVTPVQDPPYPFSSPSTAPPAPDLPPLPIPPPPQKIPSPELRAGGSARQHDGQTSGGKSFVSSRGSVTYLDNSKVSLVELSQSDIMLRMPFQVRPSDTMDEPNMDEYYEQDPSEICITIQGPRPANAPGSTGPGVPYPYSHHISENHYSSSPHTHSHHSPKTVHHHSAYTSSTHHSSRGGRAHQQEYRHHTKEINTAPEQYSPRSRAEKHDRHTSSSQVKTAATHHHHGSSKGGSHHQQHQQYHHQHPMRQSDSPNSSSSESSFSVDNTMITSTKKYGESRSASASAGRESEPVKEENEAEGSSSTVGSFSDQVIMHWMPLKTSLKSKSASKRKKHKKKEQKRRSNERSDTKSYHSTSKTEVSRHTDVVHTARPGDPYHGNPIGGGGPLPPMSSIGAGAGAGPARLAVGPSTYMKPIIWSFGDSPSPDSPSRSPPLPPPAALPPAPVIVAPGIDPDLLRQLDQMKDMFRRLQMEMRAMRQRMEHTMEAYQKHLAAVIASMRASPEEETPIVTPSLSLASQSALGVALPAPPKVDIQPLLSRIEELQKKAEQLEWAAAAIPPQQKMEKGEEPPPVAPKPIPFDLSALSQTTKEMNAELAEWLQKSIADLRKDLLDMVEVKLTDGTAQLEELAARTRSGAAGGPRMSWMGATVSSTGTQDVSMVSLPPHAANAASVLSDCQDEIRKMVETAAKQLQDALKQAQQEKGKREAAANAALNEERARLLEMHQQQRERERERREKEREWIEERERMQKELEEQKRSEHSAISAECAELASKVEMSLQHVREEVLLVLSTLPNFGGLTLDQWEVEVEKIMSTMVEESKGTSTFLYERFSQFMSYLQAQRKERTTRAQSAILESTEAMEQRRHEHHLQLQHLNHLLNRHAEAANEIALTFHHKSSDANGGEGSNLMAQKLKDEAAANSTRLRSLTEHLNRLLEASKQRQRHHKDRLDIPMKNVEKDQGEDQRTLDRILSAIERITQVAKQRSERLPPPMPLMAPPMAPALAPARPLPSGGISARPLSVKRRARKVIRVSAPAASPISTAAYVGPTAIEIAEMRRQEEREKAAMEAEVENLKERIRQVRLRKKQERQAEQERKRQEMAKTEVTIQNLQRTLHEQEEEIHSIEKSHQQLKRQLEMKARDTQRRWHQEEETLRRKVEQLTREMEHEDHQRRKEYKAAVAQVEEEMHLQDLDVARAEEEITALETAIAAKRERAEEDERVAGAQLAALQQQKANLLDRIRAEVVELQQLLEKTEENKRAASAATLSAKSHVQQEQQQMQQVLTTVSARLQDFDRQNKKLASKEKRAVLSARRSLSAASAEKKEYLQREVEKEKRLQREILNSARSIRSASAIKQQSPTVVVACDTGAAQQEQELLLLSMQRLKERQNMVERHLDEQYEQLERHRDALNSARSATAAATAASPHSASSMNGSPPRSPRADMTSSLIHLLANQSVLSSPTPLPMHHSSSLGPNPVLVTYAAGLPSAVPAPAKAAPASAGAAVASLSNSIVEGGPEGQRRGRSFTNPPPTAREIPEVVQPKDLVSPSLPASSIPEPQSCCVMQSSHSVVEEAAAAGAVATPPPVQLSRSASAVQSNASRGDFNASPEVEEPLPRVPSHVSDVQLRTSNYQQVEVPSVEAPYPMEGVEDSSNSKAASTSSQLGQRSSTSGVVSDALPRQRSGRNSRSGQSISILQRAPSSGTPRVESAHSRRSQDPVAEASGIGSASLRPDSVHSQGGSGSGKPPS